MADQPQRAYLLTGYAPGAVTKDGYLCLRPEAHWFFEHPSIFGNHVSPPAFYFTPAEAEFLLEELPKQIAIAKGNKP